MIRLIQTATVVAVVGLVFMGGAPTSPTAQQPPDVRRVARPVTGRYIVVLRGAEDPEAVGVEAALMRGGRLRHVYRAALRGFAIELTENAARALANDPRVDFVEEDGVVTTQDVQTGPPWGLDRIDQRSLPLNSEYGYTLTGTGVHAHIVDSGIRLTHSDFGGRAFLAGDYLGGDGTDCNGHGTHVAGTVGGQTYGVAKNVTLWSHRVLNCSGSGTYAAVIAAVDAITADTTHRPAVANMSLGGPPSTSLDDAVRASIAAGVVYAVAAGNSNVDASFSSPARVVEALTVGATTIADARASFSNFGPVLDLFAPGVSILSAGIASDTATATLSGTSMASPHVAGVAALYLEAFPAATAPEVNAALVAGATTGVLTGIGAGSPNRLLYSQVGEAGVTTDLVIGAFSAPKTASPGETINVSITTKNVGTQSAGATTTRLWLSANKVIDGADTLLASIPVGTLPAGDSSTAAVAVAIPGTTPLSKRFLIAEADGTKVQAEISEANNDRAKAITVGPDYTVPSLSMPGSIGAGATFTITETTKNKGGAASISTTTRYYLSQDKVPGSTGDVELASRIVPALSAGGSSPSSMAVTLPASTAAGNWYVIAVADALGQLAEVNDANNKRAVAIVVP